MGRSRELAELGSAYDSGSSLGFRNRIINGDMRIDQRNAGASVVFTGGNFPVDRMRLSVNNQGSATASAQQNLNAITPPSGFTNYIGMTVTNGTSMASGEAWRITQRIEGNNVADLGWGAAGASAVTLSFWVRSNLTGTFGGVLQNSAGDRTYLFSYAINSANTWEYKSVVVPGDTSGTWLKNNGIGILLSFSVGCGTAVQGTAGVWGSAFLDSVTGQVNVMATNGNTFYITGVQLEAGSVASPFERRPYGTELALCQRYYEKSYAIGTVPGTNTGVGSITSSGPQGSAGTTEVNAGMTFFKTTKRAAPTITLYDRPGNIGKCSRVQAGVTVNDNQPITLESGSLSESSFYAYSGSGTNATGAIIHYTASAEL